MGRIDDRQLVLKREQLETNNDQLTAAYRQLEANKQATSDKKLDLSKQVAALRQQIANLQREHQRVSRNCCDGAAARKQVDDIDNQIQVAKNNLPPPKNKSRRKTTPVPNKTATAAQQAEVNARKASVRPSKRRSTTKIAHRRAGSRLGDGVGKICRAGRIYCRWSKPLFKIADTQTMYLQAYLTSAQLKTVKLGQKVQLTADYGSGATKNLRRRGRRISTAQSSPPKPSSPTVTRRFGLRRQSAISQ